MSRRMSDGSLERLPSNFYTAQCCAHLFRGQWILLVRVLTLVVLILNRQAVWLSPLVLSIRLLACKKFIIGIPPLDFGRDVAMNRS